MAKTAARRRKRIEHASIVQAFARTLRRLRQERGLSQADLAAQSGIHWTYVGRLERGQAAPGIDLVERLSQALNVSVNDLIPAKPVAPQPFLEKQARQHFDAVMGLADAAALGTLNAILVMMKDALNRGR